MACRTIPLGGGDFAVLCGPRARRAPCGVSGCGRPHVAACDYPVVRKGRAGTCDAKMCETHRTSVGPDLDHCKAHAAFGAAK